LQKQIGRLIARIHLQGELKPFAHRPRFDIESFGYQSVDFLLDNEFIPVELDETYCGICDHLFRNIEACFDRAGNVGELRLHGCTAIFTRATSWSLESKYISSISMTHAVDPQSRIYGCFCRATGRSRRRN
jgi:hypothetical protein